MFLVFPHCNTLPSLFTHEILWYKKSQTSNFQRIVYSLYGKACYIWIFLFNQKSVLSSFLFLSKICFFNYSVWSKICFFFFSNSDLWICNRISVHRLGWGWRTNKNTRRGLWQIWGWVEGGSWVKYQLAWQCHIWLGVFTPMTDLLLIMSCFNLVLNFVAEVNQLELA